MRVLYFHQYFGNRAGSNGIRSYEMARSLVMDGHQVTMVCASFAGSTTGLSAPFVRGRRRGMVEGIDVIEFDLSHSNADGVGSRMRKFLLYALRSVGIALRHDYDVVFATSTPLTVGIPGIAAKLLRRKPFVFEVRDLWPALPRAMGMKNPLLLGGMRLLERASYAASDRVIGLAPGIVEGVVDTGKPRASVALVPNGCDFDLFDDAAPVHASTLFPESISPGDFVAIFAGAHGRANGLDAVIDAAAALAWRGREHIKVLLVGNGSEKSRLRQETIARGLTNVVFGEPVPKTQAAALIKGAGVGLQILANVRAFYDGTSPNKFFDYLAAGIPVVINYPGWLAELVRQSGCGIAVPPGDADSFADALERLADDRSLGEAMGRAARATGAKDFDRGELACKFKAVLYEVAAATIERGA